jgi:hypothetical protein
MRWWIRRWFWLVNLEKLSRTKSKILVLEVELLLTEIEFLKLEFLKIDSESLLEEWDTVTAATPCIQPTAHYLRTLAFDERRRTLPIQKFESWARDLANNPEEMTVKRKGQAEKMAQDPAGRLYRARQALKKAKDRANHAANNAKEKQAENGGGKMLGSSE